MTDLINVAKNVEKGITTAGSLYDTVKNNPILGKMMVNNINNINDKDMSVIKFKGNVRKIFNAINDIYEIENNKKEVEKEGITLKKIAKLAISVSCPTARCIALGYVTYKTVNNIKDKTVEYKDKCNDHDTFIYLYKALGFEDKMEEALYEPNEEEIDILIDQFEKRTGNDLQSLVDVLVSICNNK